jgi:hypothetical protein
MFPPLQSEEKKLDVLTAKWTAAAQEVLAELVDKAPEEVPMSTVDCIISRGVLLIYAVIINHLIECHDGWHAGVFPSRARGAFVSYSCPTIHHGLYQHAPFCLQTVKLNIDENDFYA